MYRCSPTQAGSTPDQSPVERQSRLASPISANPSKQEYVAVDRNVVLDRSTIPLVGLVNPKQSTAVQDEMELQY